jgi:hypothetical protein
MATISGVEVLHDEPLEDATNQGSTTNIYLIGGRCAVGATNATRMATGKVVEERTFLEEPKDRVIVVVRLKHRNLYRNPNRVTYRPQRRKVVSRFYSI